MPHADTSLISVIICTYNRSRALHRALSSVLRQDTDHPFEVIVVDDGSEEAVAVPPDWRDRVRLLRTPHRGVGGARAVGLNAARGELIAYCDDDDEWRTEHLSTLLGYLLEHPEVDLVYGDAEWVQEGVPTRIAYSINYDGVTLGESSFIFASDVMHRARAARDVGGFDPSLQAYEDWDLWLRMSRRYVLRHLPVVVGSHRWHPSCVSATDHPDDWRRVYDAHQARLSAAGPAARHDLVPEAAPRVPFDRRTWQAERRELIWHSLLLPHQGYGSVGRQLLLAIERQGVDVTMAPSRSQGPSGLDRFYKPLDHWGRFGFYYNYRVRPSVLPCERVVNYSMWESTAVPQDHVDEINRCVTLQYVPCRQNVASFQECGVRVPIKVLPHGVDSSQFPELVRGRSDVFTFGTFGDLSPRKGIDVLIRAFRDEFSRGDSVRLVLKSVAPAEAYRCDDPRIELITTVLDQAGLLELLRRMDAFVLPSRGEGFGLCGLEAMATGLPLIATDWTGPAEYLDAECGYPLSYRLVDAQGVESNHVRYFGLWAEPDYEHLRHLMRWLYEHPGEAAAKGRLAAQRVRERWTWDRAARQLRDDLDAIVAAEGDGRAALLREPALIGAER